MAEKLIIAGTAEEAIRSKTKENIYMAGGTEVMRLNSGVKADSYVSVRKIPSMHEIKSADGFICIGAACSFQEIIENAIVPAYLKEAAHFMASRTKRNMATIGGNIAVAGDDSYLLPTLIAAGAELILKDVDGEDKVSIIEYVSGSEKFGNKLIISVRVPEGGIAVKSVRSANTAQSRARLTASLSLKDGIYTAVAAVKNSGIYIFSRITATMQSSDPSEEDIIALVKEDSSIRLEDDLLYGSADYRRYLIGITFAMMYEELKGGRAQ